MKKIYRYLFGVLVIFISVSLITTKFDREYITSSAQEGDAASIKLEAGKTYRQEFKATRRSISQISIPISPAVVSPVTDTSMKFTILRDSEVLAVEQIESFFMTDYSPTQIKLAKPIITQPGQFISLSLTVPPVLSGNYRIQLAAPTEKMELADASLYIDDQLQAQNLAFNVYYSFRPPLSYQLGTLLLFSSLFLILNISYKSKKGVVLYIIAVSIAYIYPVTALGNFSPILLLAFVFSLVGMFMFLHKLKLPLPAIVLGAHAYAFTTYFSLHIFAGRDKLICFAFLPFVFYLLYPSFGDYRKKYILSIFVVFAVVMLLVFLPYETPSIEPIHTANLKDIFLDPNQIPTGDKFHAAYYVLQIPKGDPSIIDYYGGWENFGSYIGFINLALAFIGIVFWGKRYWLLLTIGAIGILTAATQFLTPLLAAVMPVPPQYFIIITTFTLAVFSAVGLKTLWQFLHKGPLTNMIIFIIVFFALLDLLNVTSKTLQFGLL